MEYEEKFSSAFVHTFYKLEVKISTELLISRCEQLNTYFYRKWWTLLEKALNVRKIQKKNTLQSKIVTPSPRNRSSLFQELNDYQLVRSLQVNFLVFWRLRQRIISSSFNQHHRVCGLKLVAKHTGRFPDRGGHLCRVEEGGCDLLFGRQ